MRRTIQRLREDWRAIVVQSVLTTLLFVGAIWGLSTVLGSQKQDDRIDKNTAAIIAQVVETQELLCDLLKGADDPQIRHAIEEHC